MGPNFSRSLTWCVRCAHGGPVHLSVFRRPLRRRTLHTDRVSQYTIANNDAASADNEEHERSSSRLSPEATTPSDKTKSPPAPHAEKTSLLSASPDGPAFRDDPDAIKVLCCRNSVLICTVSSSCKRNYVA